MGREVKRVALDFKWPLKKTWDGFLNPHYRECSACKAGYSRTYTLLERHVNSLVWDREAIMDPGYAKITAFLCGRPADRSSFGHDSIDAWSAIKKIGEMAGLPEGWSTCPTCKGEGVHPEAKAAYDAWTETKPPAGEGWQMWENTSEGSPISPVFDTPEKLAQWLADHRASSFGSDTATYEQWLGMILRGWAPSAVMGPNGLQSGVAGLPAPEAASAVGSNPSNFPVTPAPSNGEEA
jgi:hypothetical protein